MNCFLGSKCLLSSPLFDSVLRQKPFIASAMNFYKIILFGLERFLCRGIYISHFPLTGWQYFTKKVLTHTVETSDVGQDRQTTTSEDRATELLICKKLSLAISFRFDTICWKSKCPHLYHKLEFYWALISYHVLGVWGFGFFCDLKAESSGRWEGIVYSGWR